MWKIIVVYIFCTFTFLNISFAADPGVINKQYNKTRVHQRIPTTQLEGLLAKKLEYALATPSEIQSLIKEFLAEIELINKKPQNLKLKNLYPYQELIEKVAICQVALIESFQKLQLENLKNSDDKIDETLNFTKQLIDSLRNISSQLITLDLNYRKQFIESLMNESVNNDDDTPFTDIEIFEGFRILWCQYDRTYISKMFMKTKSFDQVMSRLFKGTRDSFMPLIIKKNVPEQGWKLHVSAKPETAFEIAKIVLPVLAKLDVDHKIAGSLDFLKELEKDKVQRGKFITIYPETDHQAEEIAKILDTILTDKLPSDHFERIENDAQLGNSGGLYTRYGSFVGTMINVLDENGNPIVNNGVEIRILDKREGSYKPYFIKNHPFGDMLTPPQNLQKHSVLTRKAARKFDPPIVTPSDQAN